MSSSRFLFRGGGCKMLLGHWPSASLRIANRIVPAGFLPRYWGASVYAALWLVAFQCSVDAVGRWKRQIRGFPSSVGECWIFFFLLRLLSWARSIERSGLIVSLCGSRLDGEQGFLQPGLVFMPLVCLQELHRVLYVRGPCWRETGTETGGETPGAAEICVLDQCLESRDIVSFIWPQEINSGGKELGRDVFHVLWCRHTQVFELNHGSHCQVWFQSHCWWRAEF